MEIFKTNTNIQNKQIQIQMVQDELAAVCLRLRVELDWVEEKLASQWAEALDDYYRQIQIQIQSKYKTNTQTNTQTNTKQEEPRELGRGLGDNGSGGFPFSRLPSSLSD